MDSGCHKLHSGAIRPTRCGTLTQILQVLVLLLTSPLPPGGNGPPRQIETPAGRRTAGRPTEGQPTGKPDGPQQHRQQLQPERQNHMRFRTATHFPSAAETLRRTRNH